MRLKTVAFLLVFLMSSYSLASEGDKNHLDGMTLLTFIHYVAKRLDQTVIISPRVRTNKHVTIFTPASISDNKLQEVFLSVLKMHGYGAVEVNGIVRIVRSRKMRSMPVPVYGSGD
ncbi:MAG: hypothetical protein ACRBCS_10535 [Cellvibrionaceae bacterium]